MIYILKLVGLVLPVLIDVINGKIADDRVRFLVAFAICAVVAIILELLGTGFNKNQIADDIAIVFGLSQVTYQLGYGSSPLQTNVRGLLG